MLIFCEISSGQLAGANLSVTKCQVILTGLGLKKSWQVELAYTQKQPSQVMKEVKLV